MAKDIIGHCPICKEKLIATKLTCKHCGLELSQEFTLSKFNYLKKEDLQFIEVYLKCRGNLKELQKQMNLSYPSAKKRFQDVIRALGYSSSDEVKNNVEVIISALPIYQDESDSIKKIKEKLNQCNGLATLTLSRGSEFSIYYEEFGNGIYATNLPSSRLLTWRAFDLAVELLNSLGGRAAKGQAMKAKLGEPGLGLDTVEGYVAFHGYDVNKGEYTIRMISALSAILEWADICINGYGYLELL